MLDYRTRRNNCVHKLGNLLVRLIHSGQSRLLFLFLRNFIPYKTAAKWLKQAYVDVAQNNPEFAVKGKKHTNN